MGGLVAVTLMLLFGELYCGIPIHGLIDFTLGSPFKVMVTNFINQLVLLQKQMTVTVLADMTPSAIHLQDPLISAKEGAWDVTENAIDNQAHSVNGHDAQKTEDDLPQQNWGEEIKIAERIQMPQPGILGDEYSILGMGEVQ